MKKLFLSILLFSSILACGVLSSKSPAAPAPWAGDKIVHIDSRDLTLVTGNPYNQGFSFFMNEGSITVGANLTQSLGAILLQNNANNFNFGGTSSVLTFDAVTGGNGSLNIFNYNYGSDPTAGGPQFRISGRPEDALSYITINGSPASYYGDTNILVASSAVPEPSTYALIAGLAVGGVAYWRKRRKVD